MKRIISKPCRNGKKTFLRLFLKLKKNPNKKIKIVFQDETRFGQQTHRTRVWAEKNTRPIIIKQTGFKNAYMFGVVEPLSGDHFAMVNTHVGGDFMQDFLYKYSKKIPRNCLSIVILDGAGWHHVSNIKIPSNLILHFLPPYCPELNPIERLWKWIKQKHLSLKLYKDIDDILQAGVEAWQNINHNIVRSVCRWKFIENIMLNN